MRARARIGSIMLAAVFVSATTIGVLGSGPAFADKTPPPQVVQAAIGRLIANPPLVNDRRAQLRISETAASELIESISAGGTPIYIVILPSNAGDPEVVNRQIRTGYRQPGTYVSIVGSQYLATSSLFPVRDLMLEAFRQERNNGTAAVLTSFSSKVSQRANGVPRPPHRFPWAPFLIVGGVVVMALGGYVAFSRRREHPEQPPTHATESSPAAH